MAIFDVAELTRVTLDDFTVVLLYVRYTGGSEGYEYRIEHKGAPVYTSDEGYSASFACMAHGLMWINDNWTGDRFRTPEDGFTFGRWVWSTDTEDSDSDI